MPAGVAVLSAEALGRAVERLLQRWPVDPGLHGDGLIDPVQLQDSAHVDAHVEADPAAHALHTAGDRGSAAEDGDRQPRLVAVAHQRAYIIARAWADHGRGQVLDDPLPQADQIGHGLAIGQLKSAVAVGLDVFGTHHRGERRQLRVAQATGELRGHRLISDLMPAAEVLIGHAQRVLDVGHQACIGVFVPIRCTPLEDGAEGVNRWERLVP